MTYDFVLVSEAEAKSIRQKKAEKALEKLNMHAVVVDGLPIPSLD